MITWKLIRREIRLIADDLFGEKVFGYTGWSDGSLYNANRPNYIKVRLTNGSQIEAWNENVPVINGILISLSIDPDNPNLYRTRRVLSRYEEDFSFVANKFHKKNHTFPGPDTVPIEVRQMMGLHPSFLGFVASVRPGWVDGVDGNPEYFPGGNVDLAQYRPSQGARYVLIYLSDLTIQVLSGDVKPMADLTLDDIPKLPESAIFIASVRLYYPQQRIVDDFTTKNDVIDFRYRQTRLSKPAIQEAPVGGKLYGRSDESWIEVIPTGGTEGQVLAKTSDNDFETDWIDPPSGGGGGGSGSIVYTEELNDPLISLEGLTTYSGAWSIDGYLKVVPPNGTTQCRAFSKTAVSSLSVNIVEIEMEVPAGFTDTGQHMSIGLNYNDVGHAVTFGLRGDGQAYFEADAHEAIRTEPYTIPTPGTWVKVRLITTGSQHTGYINGSVVSSIRWNSVPSGNKDFYPYIRVFGSFSPRFRNFKVWSLANPEDGNTESELNPLSIPGCVLFLKADAISAINGASVSTWNDLSPSANHANQTLVPQQPIYVSNAFNGKPALRFNGGQSMVPISNPLLDPSTYFVVFNAIPVLGYRNVFGIGRVGLYSSMNSSIGWGVFRNTNIIYGENFSPNPGIAAATYNSFYTSIISNGRRRFLTNTGSNVSYAARIGWDNSAGQQLTGHISEIIIYTRVLDDPELNAVNRYLGQKYGIPVGEV